MTTIERFKHEVRGVPVTAHRHNYDDLGSCWRTVFCFRMPPERKRGWLRDMIFNLVHPCGCGDPGEFFANQPIVRRRMGRVLVSQRCGYDV